ncbi:MAG: MarR family winged helix-turn-helix transcriptional regulator [Steroidobacteraceae bacterium]
MLSMESFSSTAAGERASVAPCSSALEAHLGYWLRLVSNEVSRTFERALHKRNISVAEWVAINQLAAGAGLTPAKLAATMGMTRGAISKVLDKLSKKKLISRSMSPLDSRVQLLSLTSQARRMLPRLTSVADDNDEHFFAALSSDDRAALGNLLRKLAAVHHMTGIPVE